MNHFYKDIFGWFDFEDVYQYAVRSFPSGSKFVEVGVYKGKATAFLGVEIINSGKDISLTAIDIFDPMPTEMLQGVSYSFDEFMVNMKPITDAGCELLLDCIFEILSTFVNRFRKRMIPL
jgi:hypothetical protein